MPAWGVLAEGDRITAIDGTPVLAFDDIGPLVQTLGQRGGSGMIEVERDGDRLALEIVPRCAAKPAARSTGRSASHRQPPQTPAYDAKLRYGPLTALPAALRETGRLAQDSIAMIGRLLTGRASVENVSGPITIARYANASAQLGPAGS